jgi:autotransporter-associated beta strand protein
VTRLSNSLSLRAWLAGGCILASIFTPYAFGQTWTNVAGGNWSVGANWSGGVVPTSSNTTQLTFPSLLVSAYTATNDTGISPFALNGMILNSESNGSTLGIANAAGNSLQFDGANPFIMMSGPAPATISGTTINLPGSLTVNGAGNGSLTISSQITGPNGSLIINRSGTNFLGITALTSTTSNFAGGVLLQSGALSILNSTGLGSGPLTIATTGVGLAANGDLRASSPVTFTSAVSINSGATFNIVIGSPLIFTNAISGAGSFNLGNLITTGAATFQAASSYSGPTTLTSGSLTLSGANGALTAPAPLISLLRNSTLTLDNSTANNTARITNTAVLKMARSNFTMTANANAGNNAAQTLDVLNGEGQNALRINPSTSTSATLTLNNLNRLNRGTFFAGFTSTNGSLGGPPGNNVATILIANLNGAPPASSLVGSGASGTTGVGIIPFISSDTNSGGGGNTFATYDPTPGVGLRPLNQTTEVADAISLSTTQPTPAPNVRLSVATPGLAVPATVNSLAINGANSGLWGYGGATGALTIASGGLIASGAGPVHVNVGTLNFGNAEGQLFATVSPLAVNARVTGNNGITISSHATTENLETRLMNPANSFSGPVTVNFGVLSVLQNANLGAAANTVTLNGGALRFIGDSDTLSHDVVVGAAGGAIQMAPWAATSTSLTPSVTLSSKTLTMTGSISGSGPLAINGNPSGAVLTGGIVVLAGNSAGYSGLPTIGGGVVSVDSIDGRLGTGPRLVLGGGQLLVTGAGAQSTAKNIYFSTAAGQLNTAAGVDLTINGFLTQTIGSGFNKLGPGNLTLTNTATYSGTTTIGPNQPGGVGSVAGGTLTLINNGALTNTVNLAINEGATLSLRNDGTANLTNRVANVAVTFAGGTLSFTGAAGAASSELFGASTHTAGFGSTIRIAPGAGGSVSLTGNGGVTIGNGATIVIRAPGLGQTGPNTSQVFFTTAPANVNNALVSSYADVGATPGSNVGLVVYDAVAGVRPLAAAEYTTTLPSPGTGVENVRLGAPATAASSPTINALVLDSGASVALTTGNSLTLTTGNLLASVGNAGITGGTVQAGPATSLTIFTPGTPADVTTIASTLATATAGRPVSKTGAGTLVLTAPVTATALNVQSGTLSLAAGSSVPTTTALFVQYGATLDSSAGPLQLGSIAGYGSINIGNNNLTVSSGTYNGAITGTGTLVKIGTADFHLSHSSSFTGPVEIQAGRVSFTSPTVTGGTVTLNPINAADTARLDLVAPTASNTTISTFARNIVVSPTSLGTAQIANISLSGAVNVTGSITVPTGRSLGFDTISTGFVQLSGPITGGGSIVTGPFSNLLISGNNDFAGGTTLGATSGGLYGIGSNTAFGTGPVNINATATVLFAAGGSRTLSNPLTITTDFSVGSVLGPNDLTFGPASTTTLAGTGTTRTITVTSAGNFTLNSIAGGSTAVNLAKAGGGSLTLTGASNYSGTTTVSAGSLIVAAGASINGAGAVAVGAATGNRAILGGNGSVAGPVTINSTGAISPGTSAGNLTLQNGLATAAGSTYLWELAANTTAGAGTNWDRISQTGGVLNVDPASVLLPSFIGTATTPNTADPFWQTSHRWDNIIDLTGTATNGGGSLFVIDNTPWLTAGMFSTGPAIVGSGIALTWTPVPEPIWLLSMCVGALAAGRFVRRSRR